MKSQPLAFTLNGQAMGPLPVPEGMTLLDYLNEVQNLTGTRYGCGIGVCNACTVIFDEPDGPRKMRSCITGAHACQGKRVRTIEGIAQPGADGRPRLTPLQQAYLDHFSFQCGYCTPGFVIGATVLLERLARQPIARDRIEAVVSAAMAPHVCRCTGYVRYYQAVKSVILATPGLTRAGD